MDSTTRHGSVAGERLETVFSSQTTMTETSSRGSLNQSSAWVICLLRWMGCALLASGGFVSNSVEVQAGEKRAKQAFDVEKRFKELDRNRDGKVSRDEFPQTELFNLVDANRDGQITLIEARERAQDLARSKSIPTGESTDATAKSLDEVPIRQRFKRLKPAECGVGRIVSDVSFQSIDGATHHLAEYKSQRVIVVVATSASCPLSKRYLPTLARLERTYTKDVLFIFANSTPTDSVESARELVKTHALKGPYVLDADAKLLSAVGAKSTTDCFVLDAALTLRYRGAVDDQYGLGYALAQPKQALLGDAIDAVLAGHTPQIEATDAPGCLLNKRGPATASTSQVSLKLPVAAGTHTYHNRISRIVQNNCIECHRAGGAAPFSLTSPDDVATRATMIEKVVSEGTMPPWFAAPSRKGAETNWLNDRSLVEADKADLTAWLNNGQPLGDPADAPIPRVFSNDWQIGVPDAIVQLPAAVNVPAEGVMPYQVVTVATDFGEDKWLQGFEIRPTARDVVHHIGVFVEAGTDPEKRANEAEDLGEYLALYVPGNGHEIFPAGLAKFLPKGSRLRFKLHYTPNGTVTKDQTQLAFIFAKEPPQYELHVTGVTNQGIKIPAGAGNHKESGWRRFKDDIQILSFMPHMHVRGKAFRYEMISSSGNSTTLLDVPRFDFNWQLAYRAATPITLKKGVRIVGTGWFDNSDQNPANPDPTKPVVWGAQSFDEMLIGYFEYIVPSERLSAAKR
ncbi:redoxin family protein [Schlesneria paludicola]|uniref:redoxin family protein n=1 Tax=Schlesneria paludicola TaxID=360056 RepID=UPI0006800507|nr:redoxin family protein [Schlesneria paludicola]